MKKFYVAILGLLITSFGFGQTMLYSEDFTGQNGKGAIGPTPTIDLSGVNWNIDISSAALTATTDWFQVVNEVFEARDIDGNAIWLSPSISITGYTNVSFSLDASEDGTMEAGDIFNTEYRIDGGVWTSATINGSLNDDFTSASVQQTGLTGSTLEIRVTMNNGAGAEYHRLDDILVEGTLASSDTTVQFDTSSVTVNEGDGTVGIDVSILNEDATNPTSVDVALTTGDAADINNYTTQTVTFPAGSSANQTVTITLTDDLIDEADENLTFTLQNISGGNNAQIGAQNTFDLTIEDNDLPSASIPYIEDFSDCGTQQWSVFTVGAEEEWTCDANGYFEANAFGSSGPADDYLLSPVFDMDAQTGETLNFTSWTQFADATSPQIELLYTTNFTGNPSTTSWNSSLTPTWPTPDSQTNTSSGNIDISGISGTSVVFAFRYTSTGTGAGTSEIWRIEDFEITAAVPTIGFDNPTSTENETDVTFTSANIPITVTNYDGNQIDIDVSVTGGTAEAGDFSFTSPTSLSFTSNGTQNITVDINDDADTDDETIIFTITETSAVSGLIILESTHILTIIDDEVPPAGWQITATNTFFDMDFDTTEPGVNEGQFDGSGFTPAPTTGQLNSDAWKTEGMSDGDTNFGDINTSGDFARGTSTGGETSGGFYAFETSLGNYSLGFQPGGSDFTPGTITLRAQNQTGETITAVDVSYVAWEYNDQDRGNSLNFSYSTDDVTYTLAPGTGFVSPDAADASPAWVDLPESAIITGISIPDGGYFYLRWESDDVSGSGSRDEFAIDDITLRFLTPTTYTYNGTWSPSDANGNATIVDDIEVLSGSATVTSNLSVNSVDISSGATLSVNAGESLTIGSDLTNSGTLALNSTSQLYASLIVNGTVTGDVTYNRHVNDFDNTNASTIASSNDLVSPPTAIADVATFLSGNSNLLSQGTGPTVYAFAPFNNDTGAYENLDSNATGALIADTGTPLFTRGTGFRAATSGPGQTLSFTGTVATTTVDKTISVGSATNGTDIWNLIGNPYPSHLSAGNFLSVNETNIDGTFFGVYGYDANDGDGSIWTIVDFNFLETAPNYQITPGQGFFVAAPTDGSTISFTPAMQETGTSDDFISGRNAVNTNNFAHAILNLNTASTSYVTNVYFRDINTLGLDPGYDTGAFDQNANGVYSHLVEDNAGIALFNQSLPYADLTDVVVPLVVNLNPNEQMTFSLNSNSAVPESIDVILEDNVENTFTVLNSGDYTITPSTVLSGSGRFFLRFSANALSIPQSDFDTIQIFSNVQDRTIVVAGQLNENTTASVFDLQGRLVKQVALDASLRTQTINTNGLSSGVYVVQLSNSSQSKTEKVILN